MRNITKALTILLCLVLVALAAVSCGKDPAETTVPADETTAVPEVTEPEVTEPEVTEPEGTEPEVTEPAETLPDETLPAETQPAETTPDETTPEETDPAETSTPSGDHRHQFTMTQIFPNCDTAGKLVYSCACGEVYELAGEDPLGHAWKATGSVASTCTAAGYDSYECVACGETEDRALPLLEHTYIHSVGLYAADAVRSGEAYELLACDTCNGVIFVKGNHKSGHSFKAADDGSFLCACGAKADVADVKVGSMDFTSGAAGNGIVMSGGAATADGKWLVSNSGAQSFLRHDQNPVLAQGLAGKDANGDKVEEITISFELSYTGTYEKNLNFIHLLNADGWAASIYFGTEEGKLALYDGANGAKAVLEPEATYLVKFILVPETRVIKATVEGGSFTEVVRLFEKTVTRELADSTQFGLSRPDFAAKNGEDYVIAVDNLSVDFTSLTFTSDASIEYCEHEFLPEALVDLDHPQEGQWARYTCAKDGCGLSYDMQACTEHTYLAAAVDTKPSTCVTEGEATYACLFCGTEVTEALPLADHTYAISTAVVPSAQVYEGNGFEILGCRYCDVMTVVESNHKSGHFFADGACACGATAGGVTSTEASTDFSANGAGSIAFDKNLPLADGKWNVGGSGNQFFLYPSNNPALAEGLNGYDANGETVESAAITFKLTYTGSFNKDANFINVLGSDGFLAKIHFGNVDGKLALYDGELGQKTVLEVGETYLVKFILFPSEQVIKGTVEGGTLDGVVTLFEIKAKESLANAQQIGLSRPAFARGEGEDYVISIDDMTIDLTRLTFDPSTADESAFCEHVLVATEEGMVCNVCGRILLREACETAGHILLTTIVDSKASTCTEAGYETRACFFCGERASNALALLDHDFTELIDTVASTCAVAGYNEYKCENCTETKTEKLALLPHNPTKSTGVVAAKGGAAGYELFACACGDKALKKVEGNHASGHFFENGVCACGAKLSTQTVVVATNDCTSMAGNGFAFRGGSHAMADGKLRLSGVGGHSYVDREGGNTILYDLLDGKYNGASFGTVELSFDLSYTGTIPSSVDSGPRTVFSWRDSNSNWLIDIYLKQSNGALVVYGANGEGSGVVLAADKDYRITVTIDLVSNVANVVLSGADVDPVSLTTNHKPATSIADLSIIYLTRSQHAIDPKVGAIYMDNVALGYVTDVVDTSAMDASAYCAHDFEGKASEDKDRLELVTYTCKVCGGYYTANGEGYTLLGAYDFSTNTMTSGDLKLTNATPVIEDGKFRISSLSHGRTFLHKDANASLLSALGGTDKDGDKVRLIKFSFDFSFDGKLSFAAADSGNNYVFIGLNENSGFSVSVQLRADKDGNAVVCGADKKTNLTLYANTVYTFDWYMDPSAGRMFCVVNGGELEDAVLFDVTKPTAFSTFVQLVIGRESTYYSASAYAIYLDNLSVSYDKVVD